MDKKPPVAGSTSTPSGPQDDSRNMSAISVHSPPLPRPPSEDKMTAAGGLADNPSSPWHDRVPIDPAPDLDDHLPPRRPFATYRLSDFEIHRTLGRGSFGRVHLVRSKFNLLFYVIKVLNKAKIAREGRVSHAQNERMLLQAVDHPLIMKLWGAFQDRANLYMVMEYIPGGELFTLLERSKLHRFPEPAAKFYAAEVALALNYLHSLDIIYRDLKPENILINVDGHIKLADFGFAKCCNTVTYTFCGTSEYMAPEIVRQAPYNKSVDWYAFGVLIFEMLSGYPPFYHPDSRLDLLYDRIQQGTALIRWPPFFSLPAIDLILKLMDRDPSRRYGNLRHGAGDVFAHPWFAEVNWTKLANRDYPVPYLPTLQYEGDSSAFRPFVDDNAHTSYGQPCQDEYGHLFPGFEYSSL